MGFLSISHPDPAEYAPYFGRYIQLVSGELFAALTGQMNDTQKLLAGLSEEKSLHRYAPGKWSIKEVVGHLIDAERIFAYRTLRYARLDSTPLASFDENAYVENAAFDSVPLVRLAREFQVVRESTLLLLEQLRPTDWDRTGVANNNRMTVRAMAWTIAGHEIHHRRIIEERY